MPQLLVLMGNKERHVFFEPGSSVRDILEGAGYRVRTACRGHGACGLCEILILAGNTPEPTVSECFHIPPARLSEGVRLACQLRPQGDLRLEIINPAPPTDWHSIPCNGFSGRNRSWIRPRVKAPREVRHPLGVAVDFGTTTIRLALFRLEDGEGLACRRGPNPQTAFGADVLTRLVAAQESPDAARGLSELAVSAISGGLSDIARREGIDLRRVVHLAVVGNTAMLALLADKNHRLLLQPEYWERHIDCLPGNGLPWVASWGINPQATVQVIAPLAGFVGSDLLAGLVATDLLAGPAPALFVDLGTNSEIALWDGAILWVTSAAGGPAFELCGLTDGMPAEPGAIYRVGPDLDDKLHYKVIGELEPRGFCGSGLVDLIARLLETGKLSRTGRFSSMGGDRSFVAPGTALALNMRDIDTLQHAKAAIAVGVKVLSRHSGVKLTDLRRLCVAGEFGRFLDVASAQAIGLFPAVPAERVELCGDTALLGCGDLILSARANEQLARLRACARLINLAGAQDFEDLFLSNLYLKPLEAD